jgi:ubiquinone/menaquinone biosynthesis C-methylase UbiE
MTETNEHPERFDPAESTGTLMDAEHRCRYWWAAQLAAGKDVLDAACGTGYGTLILAEAGSKTVTGIDLSPAAVNAAAKRLGDRGSVRQGDVGALPVEDNSFDLVVCFETIEHVDDGATVVSEFRRVLRPDGILLISSPNPGVYPEGNEHHVREYSPEDLSKLVKAEFPDAVEYVQHPWIASAIVPGGESIQDVGPVVRSIAELGPGQQTYTILAAGAADLPGQAGLVTLGESFEVSWWSEQLQRARAQAGEIEEYFTREINASLEREHAAGQRLNEANGRVLAASEELSRLRTMESYYLELRELNTHYDVAVTRLREIESSRAWKLLAPLRRLRRG